jgi:DUF4097 and DUF4098 domain-containing protein YvlB
MLITAVVAAMLAIPSIAQQKIDEKHPAPANGKVEISNVSGSIRVTGWDREEVAVTGTLGRGTERLEFATTGSTTVVKVILPRHADTVDGSDLEVQVPKGSRVDVDAVSADVSVDQVTGELEIESVSGDVKIGGKGQRIEAKSVSGAVDVVAEGAPVRAKSVSGTVTVRGARGDIEAQSVSGRVKVEGTDVARAELHTTSGEVRFEGSLAGAARFEAKSVSGTVDVVLPADVSAEFEVSTFSGNIHNDFGQQAHKKSEYGPGEELTFTTGKGGAEVRVKSFSGNVALRKR